MKPLPLLMAAGLVLGLAQQQLLIRRPPRLVAIEPALASSGPGALDLRFSRPMELGSVGASSSLSPELAHGWLGEGSQWRLLLSPGARLDQPIELELGGRDRRQLAVAPQRWRWDPRPRMVAVVVVPGGEQLQLRHQDGSWQAISEVWPSIPHLQVLGDGSGLVMATADGKGRLQVWRLAIQQSNLAPANLGLKAPLVGAAQRLSQSHLLFAHMSSNRQGEFLLQSATELSGQAQTQIWNASGGRTELQVESSGAIQLVPQGGAMVVPHPEGLILMRLPGQPQRRQMLPGSRDLSSFCASGGRALLVRHRPDYSRSLELVEPGEAPRILWQGRQAVLGSACARGGERIWLLLMDGMGQPRLQLLALNRSGKILQQKQLNGWQLEPGTKMEFDASRNQLLLAVKAITVRRREIKPIGNARREIKAISVEPITSEGRQEARPALIDANSLTLRVLDKPIRQVQWLPAH